MKRVFILLSALVLTQWSFAFNGELEVNTTIQNVKVFREGAQVTRIGQSNIPAGQTLLKFTGLPTSINYESIQLKADGDFTILSVNVQYNYLKEQVPSAAYLQLQTQHDTLQMRLKREQVLLALWKDEEALILANKDLSRDTGTTAARLSDMTEYYRKNLRDVKFKVLDSNIKIEQLTKEVDKIKKQLDNMNKWEAITEEIWVNILANTAVQSNFELSYVVHDAGWYPVYDFRINDINNPISLSYKAKIYQSSGEDWQNVRLSLSSGNPNLSATKPDVTPWRLGFWEGPLIEYDTVMTFDPETYKEPYKVITNETYPDAVLLEKTTVFEFQIELPYTIPSDSKKYTVQVKDYTVPAYYEYYTAPKFDPTVYLTAKVSNWEQYYLLNGYASLFFEGAFIGETAIDGMRTEDTLTLSLGRDESVVVTRKKEAQNANNQFIGNKKTEVRGWDIELRNKKKQAINMVVEDQYPIATNDEIEVTLESANGAQVDKEMGILKWKLKIEPNQSEKLNFQYAVKLPKKKKVILE